MNDLALIIGGAFILIPVLISWYQQLGLGGSLLWSACRAFLQLTAVGYLLNYVFELNDKPLIFMMLAVMMIVAGENASRRGKGISGAFGLVLAGIFMAEAIILTLWLTLGVIDFTPRLVIPMSGMVIGNAMVAAGLALDRLRGEMRAKEKEILASLALGANSRQAANLPIKSTIKAAMIPSVDSLRTMGLVQLPGMMTGLIIGGVNPIEAVKYQIVIVFSITAATALATMVVTLLSYRRFFTKHHQLIEVREPA